MSEHTEVVKSARNIVEYCKNRKCVGGCVFYREDVGTCLVRFLADYNWCSNPLLTFKEVEENLEKLERVAKE